MFCPLHKKNKLISNGKTICEGKEIIGKQKRLCSECGNYY